MEQRNLMFLNILKNLPDKFHVNIMGVVDKKYLNINSIYLHNVKYFFNRSYRFYWKIFSPIHGIGLKINFQRWVVGQ